MRPRQSRLGISDSAHVHARGNCASMRPRQSRLGIWYWTHEEIPEDARFNEAEAITPRNEAVVVRDPCDCRSFNEAEAITPRNRAGDRTANSNGMRASMRPRQSRLGIPKARPRSCLAPRRFNEAEAITPRNYVLGVWGYEVAVVVASMRPRQSRLGIRTGHLHHHRDGVPLQ